MIIATAFSNPVHNTQQIISSLSDFEEKGAKKFKEVVLPIVLLGYQAFSLVSNNNIEVSFSDNLQFKHNSN